MNWAALTTPLLVVGCHCCVCGLAHAGEDLDDVVAALRARQAAVRSAWVCWDEVRTIPPRGRNSRETRLEQTGCLCIEGDRARLTREGTMGGIEGPAGSFRHDEAVIDGVSRGMGSAGEGWVWFVSSGWEKRTEHLFDLAAEVAARLGAGNE